MSEIVIPAVYGPHYELKATPSGCLRLARVTKTGSTVCLIFSPDDALAVADALVDLAESIQR